MSTETHVFFAGPLPSRRALQGAMNGMGFSFRLSPATGRLEDQDGYMPMRFRREDTGVEFDVFDGRDAVEEFTDLDIDPALYRVANFRWGGNLMEAAAAQCGAAALAKLVGGIVFDEAEDRMLSVDEAAEVARQTIAAIPPPVPKRHGTRQADFKRYLKPLLERRSDLVLTGRLLLIQPVRHLLRGAWFEPSRDRTRFHLNWFAQPLAGGAFLHDRVATLDVDEPRFIPLFYHCLQKHVFEHLGRITTFEAYCDADMWMKPWVLDFMEPTFLSRGMAAAAKLVAENAVSDPPESVSQFRTLAAKGEDALLQHYREKEAKTVDKLKIPGGWEQVPFPIEVLPEEREARTSEPVFQTEPWVKFDSGWRADMPQEPGEVRFADSVWDESGEYFLVGPIAPEEAERRRAEIRSYAFAKRLEGGALVVLQRRAESETSLALLLEEAAARRRLSYGDQYLRVEYPTGTTLLAQFFSNFDRLEQIRLWSVDIYDASGKEVWDSLISNYRGVTFIQDFRSKEVQKRDWKFGDDELAAVTLPNPEYDDYRSFLDCVTAFLMKNGYGALK